MKRKDIARLLGGYAADNLTAEEREALFAAALEDQELFDALAREQSLRDLLQDPSARRDVLAALEGVRAPWWRRAGAWLRRPAVLAAASGMAAVVGIVSVLAPRRQPEPAPRAMVAQVPEPMRQPASPAAAPPAPMPKSPSPPAGRPAAVQPSRSAKAAAEEPAPKIVELEPPSSPGVVGGVPGGVIGGVLPAPASPRPMVAALRGAAVDARSLYLGRNAVAAASGFARDAAAAPARREAAGTPNLGLRCRLLRRDADGNFEPVDPDTQFRAGEPVRLSLEPNRAGYLYVLAADAPGSWRLLFSSKVEAGRAYPVALESARAAAVLASEELAQPASALPGTPCIVGAGSPEDKSLYGVALEPQAREVGFEIPIRR